MCVNIMYVCMSVYDMHYIGVCIYENGWLLNENTLNELVYFTLKKCASFHYVSYAFYRLQ